MKKFALIAFIIILTIVVMLDQFFVSMVKKQSNKSNSISVDSVKTDTTVKNSKGFDLLKRKLNLLSISDSALSNIYFKGEYFSLGICETKKINDSCYQIIVPAGPYFFFDSRLIIEAGFLSLSYKGNVNGASSPCDGANKWVQEGGWSNFPSFLQGRDLICPETNFMDLVLHNVDVGTQNIFSSSRLHDFKIVKPSRLVFGPNEPFRSRDRTSAKDNLGQWIVNLRITKE